MKGMQYRLPRFLLAILLVSILAGGAFLSAAQAQEAIRAELMPANMDITVGDVVPLTLKVMHPSGWRVIIPTLDKQWGEFEVRGQTAPTIVDNADGTQTTIQEILVSRMRPGEALTPAIALSIADDQGSLHSLEAAPLSIAVRSVLVEGDTTLREIKPQAELISERRPIWPLTIAGLLCLAVVIGSFVKRWQARKQIDRRTSRQRALDSLKGLSRTPVGSNDETQARWAQLADTLRDYIGAITDIPARDLTTREINRRLMSTEIPAEWSTQVIGILMACDSVKYAKAGLDEDSFQVMVSNAEKLVGQFPAQQQPKPKSRRIGGIRKLVRPA